MTARRVPVALRARPRGWRRWMRKDISETDLQLLQQHAAAEHHTARPDCPACKMFPAPYPTIPVGYGG